MENSFYSLLFRQKYIKRWGLMRNNHTENLTEHSAETAVLAHALAVIGNTYFGRDYDVDRAAAEALFHDAAEVYTGDLPTPIKYYNKDMRERYREIENDALEALISKLPPEMRPTYKKTLDADNSDLHTIIKAADKLSAYIKCIEEEHSGNPEFSRAKEATFKALKKYSLPELDFFIENFLPAFGGTIDEL